MSDDTKPTAADLRAYADAWQRGSAVEPALCRYLRAGADAMDEQDAADGYIAELNAALAQDRAELARLREVVNGLDSACDDEEASHQETLMMLARLRAELGTERAASHALFVKLSYALGIKPDKQSWPVLCASFGPCEPAAEAADRVIAELARLRAENAELARLRAENAELAEALRPFALGTYPGAVMPDDCCLWEIVPGRSDGIISRATVGDSRRAAAVLAKRESVV